MSDETPCGTADRVPLNLRVDSSVVETFESCVAENWGNREPYAGVELERELRHMVDDGRVGRLWEVTNEVMVELGIPTGQKNSSEPPSRDGRDPTVVRYHVDPDLRRQFLTLADDDSRSAGRIVEDIMYRYARDGGGVIDRVIDRLERVTTADDDLKPEKGATERRRDTLATTLAGPERMPWRLDDMDTALDEEVRGVSASKHARQKHLQPVLDRIDYTWHPQNPRLFYPREEVDVPADDDRRDPRGRPPVLHDSDTMRVAVATEAVEKALDTTGRVGKLSLGEASDVIGKPDYSGLKTAFQAAESRYDCAKVVDRDGSVALAVRVDTYRENPPRELQRHVDDTPDGAGGTDTDAGVIDGGTDADGGEPEPDGDAPDDWVAAAAELYPDDAPPDAPENLMNNCIMRVKTGSENVPVEQVEAVSEHERQLVRDRLSAADSDADTPARTRQKATDGGKNGDPEPVPAHQPTETSDTDSEPGSEGGEPSDEPPTPTRRDRDDESLREILADRDERHGQ